MIFPEKVIVLGTNLSLIQGLPEPEIKWELHLYLRGSTLPVRSEVDPIK